MGLPTKLPCRACYIPNRHQKGLHRAQRELLTRLCGMHLSQQLGVGCSTDMQPDHSHCRVQPRHYIMTLRSQCSVRTQWRVRERCSQNGNARCITQVKEEWVCGTGDTEQQPGVAKCSWLRPWIIQQWWWWYGQTLPEGNHIIRLIYYQSKSVETLYVSSVSHFVWCHLYCLPYIVLVHEQIHTLGESKTAFSVKSPLVTPQTKKPLQISIQFPH